MKMEFEHTPLSLCFAHSLSLHPFTQTPMMVLGSHQLKGSVETLKQPFCLLRKQYNHAKELQSYQIKGIVKQKYLFNNYPKVIMR